MYFTDFSRGGMLTNVSGMRDPLTVQKRKIFPIDVWERLLKGENVIDI